MFISATRVLLRNHMSITCLKLRPRSGVVAIDSIFNIIEPMKREGRPVGRRHLISLVVGDERAADGTINCRESGSARGQIEKLSVGVKLMHAHPRRRESLTCRS